MHEKRVCAQHGHTLMQCRCPAPDKTVTRIPCDSGCPDYGQPVQFHDDTLDEIIFEASSWADPYNGSDEWETFQRIVTLAEKAKKERSE